MNYKQAVKIVQDWKQNYFLGRVKTKQVVLAEIFLRNPEGFLSQASKTIGQKYTRLSRLRKAIHHS